MFKALLVIFCFFSATGSFPVDLFGAKLSNVVTLIFCAAMPVFLMGKHSRHGGIVGLVLVGALFITWQSLSALWAPNIAFSAYRALVVDGYMFLAIALPIAAVARRVDMIAIYGRVTVFASVLLIVSYATFLPLGARAVYPQLFVPGFALVAAEDFDLNDPNIVACALSVGLICALATIDNPRRRLIGASVCTVAILVTQSRTALFFLPTASLVAALLTRNVKAAINSLLALLAVVGIGLAVIALFGNRDDVSGLTDAFQDRFFSDSASNEDRWDRLHGAIDALREPLVALFGLGAGGSISSGLEPHNMFLSFFLELGFFGLVLFMSIFALVGWLVHHMPDQRMKYHSLWLLLFILFACLTYWHTRTLWFSLSLIVFSFLRQRYREKSTQVCRSRKLSNVPAVAGNLKAATYR